MADKGMFKKSLFGFKKKQVLNYIYELTSEHKNEIDSLCEEKNLLEAEADALRTELEAQTEALKEARKENEETLAILEGVTDECAMQKEEIATLSRRVKYYTERQLLIEREISAARENAAKINIEARKKADEIISRSREYTKLVEANIELVKKDAEEIRGEIRDSLSRLEVSLNRLDEIGADKLPEVEVPTYSAPTYKKPKKTTRGILEEIKNILRGVNY